MRWLPSFSVTQALYSIRHLPRRIWFRASTYGVAGVMTAFIGLAGAEWIPIGTATKIGSDSVGNILAILASSMLAVATFSLSIMVTAFGNVSSSATPRASRLLIENQRAQKAVATFIGAFLYSIVGIIALATGAYGEQGRFVLFLVTILVILLIVTTLIRWVDQLSTLGRVGDTIAQVEHATRVALRERSKSLFLGGSEKTEAENFSNHYCSPLVGFIVYVNIEGLNAVAEEFQTKLALEILPGSFAFPNRSIFTSEVPLTEDTVERVLSHVVIEPSRTFDQDPQFGFVLLSEIATRALSAAVNDPGTVIEVLGASTRLMDDWARSKRNAVSGPVKHQRVYVPRLRDESFLTDLYLPILRDGVNLLEIAVWVMKTLKALRPSAEGAYAKKLDELLVISRDSALKKLNEEYEKRVFLEMSS